MKNREHRLLREYLRIILSEDEGFGGHGADAGAMYSAGVGVGGMGGGMGMPQMVSNDVVKRALWDPLVAPFKVLAAESKQLMSIAVRIFKVIYNIVGTTLVPFLTDSYKEIEKEDITRRNKIKSEYKQVYDGVYSVLLDNDFAWTAFMMFPGAFLTAKLALDSPKVFKHGLSLVSGGSVEFHSHTERTRQTSGYARNELLLIKEADEIKDARAELEKSSHAAELKQTGEEFIKQHLSAYISAVKDALTSDTLAECIMKSSEDTAELVDLLKSTAKDVMKGDEKVADPKQLAKVIDGLSSSQKKSIASVVKKYYADIIKKEMKQATTANHEIESQYIDMIEKPYRDAIKAIEGLTIKQRD